MSALGFDPVTALNLLLERLDNLIEALNKLTTAIDDHAETEEQKQP